MVTGKVCRPEINFPAIEVKISGAITVSLSAVREVSAPSKGNRVSLVSRRCALLPRLLFALIAASALFAAPITIAFAEPAAAQVTPLDDDGEQAPGLGDITGSPDAGPEPEDAGDRGGAAQLVLAVMIFGGIAFIVSRIALATRSRSSNAT